MIENSDSKLEIGESRIVKLEEQLSDLMELLKKKNESDSKEGEDYAEKVNATDQKINHLIELLRQKNSENEDLKIEIQTANTELSEIRNANYHPIAQEEKIKRQEKRINELTSEGEQFKNQINELKKLIDEKDKEKKDLPKIIEERDELIKKLNDQLLVLKEQKRMLDEVNSKLISEVDYMQSDIKRLDTQLSEKDKQIKDIRQMLQSEKELSEQRLRKRLRSFAEKETRKEVLLTVKIKELIDIIMKQRDVIENINQADLLLYDQFNNTIKQIHEKRSTIDYSVVDEKLDDIKVDVAAISDLVNKQESEIVEAIEAKNEKEFDIEGNENIQEEYNKEVVEAVRRSLENGDPVEIIKNTLVEKGEDEETVQKIIDLQMKELNIKL